MGHPIFLIIHSNKCVFQYSYSMFLLLNSDILERKEIVKNLGVTFDENMFWTNHINTAVSKAYGRLKQAYKFRNFLSFV